MSIFNDGIHDTVMNITADLLNPINNLFIIAEFRLSESATDRNYEKVLFRSNLDGKKLLKGIRGNYLISLYVDILTRSADFKLAFPFKRVKLNPIFPDLSLICDVTVFLQKVYRFINLTMPIDKNPFKFPKFLMHFNYTAIMTSSNKRQWLCSTDTYVEWT
jgi:hypothetical protein